MDAITIPIQFDILQLWLLSSAIPDDAFSNPGEELGGSGLLDQVQDGLVFCADTNEEKATLLLTDNQCRLIAAVVTMNAYASDGRPIGRELLLKVFRARHAIRHGTIAVATDPDPLEKVAVMEMLYLRGDDK